MGWAEEKREMVATVLSTQLPAVQERLDRVDPVRTPEEKAAHEADREAIRALFETLNANITTAQTNKIAAQAILDAVAPTNVAQVWKLLKDVAKVERDNADAIIDVARGTKALAKYVREFS